MNDRAPAPEAFARCVVRAAGFGALLSAAVGAAECGKLLAQGVPRYADLALRTALVGVAGYAILGISLGASSGILAWFLWNRPSHRTASASTCAALGTLLAVAAFVLTAQVGAALLLPAALCGTLFMLALREMLGWIPWLSSARLWAMLGALALAAGELVFMLHGGATAGPRTSAPVSKARPNVLLVTVDTLRADHVGCYGASDARTPAIDALAAQSVQFLDATSQANTTGPSHTSMLTGMYPHEHGATHNGVSLSHSVRTLPELLQAEGFQTAASVSGFTLVQEACGLAPRFERYDDDLLAWHWLPAAAARLRLFKVAIQLANQRGFQALRADRPAHETVDSALAWLSSRENSRPFFLWTHFYDPHCPYQPPPPFDRMHDESFPGDPARNWYKLSTKARRKLLADPREVEHMRSLYKGEISYTDSELARLFKSLKDRGEFDNTLVILTSDHGEGLGEHEYWFDHGTFLYDAELSVPLLIHFPAGAHAGKKVASQVRLIDIMPTVMEVLGLENHEKISGLSLIPTLDETTPQPRPSFAQGDLAGDLSGYELDGRKLSLRVNGRKLIWTSDSWLDSLHVPETWESFDLKADPSELTNRWSALQQAPAGDEAAKAFGSMRTNLDDWRSLTAENPSRPEISPEIRSRLKAIGY
jgi:arylsulfatase A-like enzyme